MSFCPRFKFIRLKSEKDKNHKSEGTNVASSGVIPFMEIGGRFNPGKFVEFYLDHLPESTQDNTLFPRARKQCRTLNIHAPNTVNLYEANMKGQFSSLSDVHKFVSNFFCTFVSI